MRVSYGNVDVICLLIRASCFHPYSCWIAWNAVKEPWSKPWSLSFGVAWPVARFTWHNRIWTLMKHHFITLLYILLCCIESHCVMLHLLHSVNKTEIICTTPPVANAGILPIMVSFDEIVRDLQMDFEYSDDPSITSIQPLSAFRRFVLKSCV